MRLGQLARKLDLRPIDIVNFLADKNITIEEGTNTKVDDAHTTLVIQHFAPTMSLREASTPDVQPPLEPVLVNPSKESVITEAEIPVEMKDAEADQKPEDSDVIKAPKIELSGLKIIGKIDLPEPKKKPEETPENASSDSEQPKETGREKRNVRSNRPQRPRQNPISLQREQEALEAQRKKEEELQRQKERRTQNYLKKVKAPQPTKAVKFVKEKTEQMTAAELAEPPKTLWGRFIKWLTT